jgi:nicotinamidase-related amidase
MKKLSHCFPVQLRCTLFLLTLMTISAEGNDMYQLTLRSQEKTVDDNYTAVEEKQAWDPAKSALIICDMWDGHWCKGAGRRVGELAEPMNVLIKQARERGTFIIHAPSSVVDFYKHTPQRKRAQSAPLAKAPIAFSVMDRWGTKWCWPDPKIEPDMPIDDSDMGCDCKVKCSLPKDDVAPWTRQIKTLEMQPTDAVSHDSQEVYNLLAERGIDHVMIMGVHLNMCVLGRPFGIRQMVKAGKNIVLVRDMTDSMYNSQKKPFVDHFSGTDLVVDHVEKYWCPTISSDQLTGKPPFKFQEDPRK